MQRTRRVSGSDLEPVASVSENRVVTSGYCAMNDIRQVLMQLDGRVLRAGETSATEHADGHIEITTELLAKNIGSDLRGAKQGMQAGIDRHGFINAVEPSGVVVPGIKFNERQVIGTVAVNLVGARKAERTVFTEVASRYEQV